MAGTVVVAFAYAATSLLIDLVGPRKGLRPALPLILIVMLSVIIGLWADSVVSYLRREWMLLRRARH